MTTLFQKITGMRQAITCAFIVACMTPAVAQPAAEIEASGKARIQQTVVNGFTHPGIGLNKQLLEDARAQVLANREPWHSGFIKLAASPRSARIVSSRNQGKSDPTRPEVDAFDNAGVEGRLKVDSDVALHQVLMYWFTGDATYFANALRIVRIWSKMDPAKYKAYREVYIHCSFAFKDMIVVAEILRAMEAPSPDLTWTGEDTAAFTNNFIVPGVRNFFDHNGWFMNQNGFAYAPAIAGAIFQSDPQELAKRVERFTVNKSGPNKGWSFSIMDLARLVDTNALTGEKVANPQVQITEMGRDQAHAGDDLTIFTTICRILNSQGIKVDPKDGTVSTAANAVGPYEFLDDRILVAADHFCRFMLGHDTRWIPTPCNIDPDGTVRQIYPRIADNYRGRIRQHRIWDLYYYYTYEKGVDLAEKAPYYHETYLKRIVSGDYDWLYIPKQASGDALRIPPSEQEPDVVEVEMRSSNLTSKSVVRSEDETEYVRVLADPQGTRLSVLSSATDRKTIGLRVRTNGVATVDLSGFGNPWLLPDTRGQWRRVTYTMSPLERFGDIVFFNVMGAPGTTVDIDQLFRRPEDSAPAFAAGNIPVRLVAYVGAPIRLDFSAARPGAGAPVSITSRDMPAGAVLDPATGAFSWQPGKTGDHVFVVEASDGITVKPKQVTISVVEDRATALAGIMSGRDEKMTYVTATIERCMALHTQARNALGSADDAGFFALLVKLKNAIDSLEPLTPLLPDGSMDFPRLIVSSNIGAEAANLLVDGNDDTFVGFYLAKDRRHEFDFGPDFKFSATAFALEGRVNFEDRVDNTKFHGSNDRVNWTELTPAAVTRATELTRVAVADHLAASTFRYLRVQKSGGSMIEPSEMRLFGRRHESGNKLDVVAPGGAGHVAQIPGVPEAPAHWGDWPLWGDQGDGNYRNPVLPADYSDLDCIRVGADYYAISSTFQYSPGMVILHSKDLVNWRILGHVIDDVTQIGPEMNWDRMNRYGRGVWAGAIRHHAGKYRVYFGTPDEGYFMSTADNPAGPWEPLHRVMSEPGWDDCCPFWDDDGQGYFAGTHFKDGYKTWLYKLTPDGRDIIPESRVLINEGARREASKLFKVGDTYYHFFSEVADGGRHVMMQRAKSITGPYTEKRQLSHPQREFHEPNQGGIVQTEAGDWYFLTHHGAGDWEGRPASLLPVTWVDGWPVLGKVGADGIGTMVWSGKKPVQGGPVLVPPSDDDFSGPRLGVQWEWNYQPRADKWSLGERPGWLRLHAWKPLRHDDLKRAGNTLTQRVMRTRRNVVTVELDPAGMADGQVAGLCMFHRDYATIAVRRAGDVLTIESARNQTITAGPVLDGKPVWLRSEWGLDGICRFSYSIDNKTFTTFGEPFRFGWSDYRGERIGLFSYNNSGEAGHADFGSFTYHYDSPLTR